MEITWAHRHFRDMYLGREGRVKRGSERISVRVHYVLGDGDVAGRVASKQLAGPHSLQVPHVHVTALGQQQLYYLGERRGEEERGRKKGREEERS